ncbi:unannotated protein [freshwater metagenome]|uniref:Unannotated protein n=2 Tax=freshwater metagenome TaxID=449393 RepID=A0A6J6LY62_9ZZZZ
MFDVPEFVWSKWIDLRGAQINPQSPKDEGVYRIRDRNSGRILYVGETNNLRRRFSHLQNSFSAEIPYADPHTAAPALWAYLQENDTSLDISFIIVQGSRAKRMTVETSYIAILRHEVGESPLANFGQMPNGWIKSSGNSSKLVQMGKRFKGYRNNDAIRTPSMPSILDLSNSSLECNWGNLQWSNWEEFPISLPPHSVIGLYRIRRPEAQMLSYIGQGKILARLKAHSLKYGDDGHAQSHDFSPGFLTSWTSVQIIHSRQLLEMEADLIASHYITLNACPTAQFIG